MNRLLMAILLAGWWGTMAYAQEASEPITTLKAGTSLVLVPAMVRTKAGAPVFTLQAKDFLVTDDGVPQVVRLEEDTGAQPLALVVVIEDGGDGASKFDLSDAGDDDRRSRWRRRAQSGGGGVR